LCSPARATERAGLTVECLGPAADANGTSW
jgi:hypothetical protein